MKTNYVPLLALFLLNFFSCSTNDDDSKKMEIIADPIIGDWTYDNAAANADIEGLDIEYSIDDPFYTFNPDGIGMQGVTITIAGNDPEKFEQKFYWENGNVTADFTERSHKYVFKYEFPSDLDISSDSDIPSIVNVSSVFSADFNSVELIFSDSKDSLILTRKQ